MDRRRGGGTIKGMAKCFAINGHHIAPGSLAESTGPRDKALGQLCGVHPRQDAPKGVMTRDVMRQVEDICEPLRLGLPVLFNILPPLCPTDHGTHRNDENIHQEMTTKYLSKSNLIF